MSLAPETRASLLIRVRDPADHLAWVEFVQVYHPVILRVAQLKGLQTADAEDVAQRVLVAVAKAVENWQYDPKRAKFRTWLLRVANNAVLDVLTRVKPDRGVGGAESHRVLQEQQSRAEMDSDLFRLEYRREIFHWAARQLREEFRQDTWEAFWQTAVEGRSIDEVAKELGKEPGAIYAARSRVMRAMQNRVGEYEQDF